MRRGTRRQGDGRQWQGWGHEVRVTGEGFLTLPPQLKAEMSLFLFYEAESYKTFWN